MLQYVVPFHSIKVYLLLLYSSDTLKYTSEVADFDGLVLGLSS